MVYVTTSPSRASGNSSMTNGNAAFFAPTKVVVAPGTTLLKHCKHGNTHVQEGTFVFQVIQPEMLAIRRLQDLYEYHQRGIGHSVLNSMIGDETGISFRSTFGSDPTVANPVLSTLSNDDKQQHLSYQQKQQDQSKSHKQPKQSTSEWFNTNFIGDFNSIDEDTATILGTPVFKKEELVSVDMIVVTKRSCNLLELKSFCSSNYTTPLKSLAAATGTTSPKIRVTAATMPNTNGSEKDDAINFDPSFDDEAELEGDEDCVEESDEKTVVPDNASVTTAGTHISQTITSTAFARLSDHSGWITIEINGEEYVNQVPVETGLYTFYIDNFSSGGVTPRRHPMDDSSSLLSTENCIQDIVHIQPMTQIFCDYKVVHPVTNIEFYRIQCTNSSYFPLWVHNVQYSNDPQRFPNVYKLLPINKYTYGTFAYRALQSTLLRSIPDCSESSKVQSDKAIIRINEIVVADVIRESPIPMFGNGPFIRLNSYGWLFEKKLHERVLEPIPIECGHWEILIISSKWLLDGQMSDSVDSFGSNIISKKEQQQTQEECIMVFQQPLGRPFLHGGYLAKLHVGDIIQCDRKITVQNKATISEDGLILPATNHELYRVILNDTKSGWIMNNNSNTTAETGDNEYKQAMLQLLSCDEIELDQSSLLTKVLDPPTKDELIINTANDIDDEYYDEDDNESSADDEWTPELVREIAIVCGSILKEIDYQPIGNVLKFETRDMILINIFCTTRTVQTAFEDFVDFESIGMNNTTSRHGCTSSNMMYQCYRNCSIHQLTRILQITVVTLMSKTVLSMSSSSHEEDDSDGFSLYDDEQIENGNTGRQRRFLDPNNGWDNIEDEKKDETDGVLDETLENVLSRNTALLDALAFQASIGKRNNKKRNHRKKRTTNCRLYFRETKEQGIINSNTVREKRIRMELLRCEMDILKLLSKRQQLWETVHQFEEQRTMQSQHLSKIRLHQMN